MPYAHDEAMQHPEHTLSGKPTQPHRTSETSQSPSLPAAFLSIKDTAQVLGFSRWHILRAYHGGLLPGIKLGQGYGILRSFVEDLIAEVTAGRQVNIEEFAAEWLERTRQGVAV